MKDKFTFTSESVTEGHPDKIADQISDKVLDECLKRDPNSRVACETLIKSGLIVLAGEITSKATETLDYHLLIREKLTEIGYNNKEWGFDINQCSIVVNLNQQSADVKIGVDKTAKKKQGAGDQGLMFGYATNETENFMPLPIHLAHRLAERLALVRKKGILKYLGPDGKTQVSIEYEGNQPKKISTVVISTQHSEKVSLDKLKKDIKKEVADKILPAKFIDEKTIWHINPTGKFVIGGPKADAGLTGRKIIVDSYGGMGRHGGGAFSGKDPSKVDRSSAYAARYIAKNIVAAGLFDECEVQLSYAIGIAEPISININSFGNTEINIKKLKDFIYKNCPTTPENIIKYFDLKKPIYQKTATYGHFGRNLPEFSWEKLDLVKKLQKEFKK